MAKGEFGLLQDAATSSLRSAVTAASMISSGPRDEGLERLGGDDTMAGHDTSRFAEHERTYAGFLTLLRWGTGSILAVLALMAIFLLRH